MTNTVAAILTIVATNWTYYGTITFPDGSKTSVEKGVRVTNITAVLEYKNQKKEFILESFSGSSVGTREGVRVNPNFNWPTNYIIMTNLFIEAK